MNLNNFKLLLGLFIFVTLSYFLYSSQNATERSQPNALVQEEPIQNPVDKIQFTINKYKIDIQASLDIKGRVLGKRYYTSDITAPFSPVDLALGWGYMSDTVFLNRVQVKQRNRWSYWQITDDVPIDNHYIIRHTANIHVVPENQTVLNRLKMIKVDNVVQMQGYLINVTSIDGYRWLTSLSRTDTGANSCEILLVTDLNILY